jgi:predicted nucleic acid-binding protein
MTFGAIPAGAAVFLDANVLVYYFSAHATFGQPCRSLFERVDRQEILGFTTAHAVSEMAHRLMTIEAIQRLGWPPKGIAYRLRSHPADVMQLTQFQQAVSDVSASRIQILLADRALLSAAAAVSRQTGLLTNDALTIAVMQAHGITNLASHDADFDRVPGIMRYGPV